MASCSAPPVTTESTTTGTCTSCPTPSEKAVATARVARCGSCRTAWSIPVRHLVWVAGSGSIPHSAKRIRRHRCRRPPRFRRESCRHVHLQRHHQVKAHGVRRTTLPETASRPQLSRHRHWHRQRHRHRLWRRAPLRTSAREARHRGTRHRGTQQCALWSGLSRGSQLGPHGS